MYRAIFSFILLLTISGFFSCKKSGLIGSDILPKGDNLSGVFTDTLSLFSKTIREDSFRTTASVKYLLGSMKDNVFGKTVTGVYTQFKPGTFNPSFLNCTIDSVVLSLVYAGSYGDVKNTPQSVTVYQLTQQLTADSAYYSSRTFAFNPIKIGEKVNFIPDFSTYPIIIGDTMKPTLRVRLNDQFGQDMLDADSVNLTSPSAFQAFMKGLYITSDENNPGKGIIYLDLANSDSRITLYYHNATSDSLQFNFLMGSGCASVNSYKHDYTGYPVEAALNSSAKSDSVLYIQSMAGVKSKITVPFLQSLGRILVNKAEVEVTQIFDPVTDDSVFHVPVRMILLGSDSLGRNTLIPDLYTTALLKYGSNKFSFVNDKGQTAVKYSFSIADQLQLVVNKLQNGEKDYGLFLVNYQSTELADRIVLGGGNRKDAAQMKLKLTYTKLP